MFVAGCCFDELPPAVIMEAVHSHRSAGGAVFFDPGPRSLTFRNPDRKRALHALLDSTDVVLMTQVRAGGCSACRLAQKTPPAVWKPVRYQSLTDELDQLDGGQPGGVMPVLQLAIHRSLIGGHIDCFVLMDSCISLPLTRASICSGYTPGSNNSRRKLRQEPHRLYWSCWREGFTDMLWLSHGMHVPCRRKPRQ